MLFYMPICRCLAPNALQTLLPTPAKRPPLYLVAMNRYRTVIPYSQESRNKMLHMKSLPIALLLWIALLILSACSTDGAGTSVEVEHAAHPSTAHPSTAQEAMPYSDDTVVDVPAEGYIIQVTAEGIEAAQRLPGGIVPIRFAAGPGVPAALLLGRIHAHSSQEAMMQAMMEGGPLQGLGHLSLLGGAMLEPGQSKDVIFQMQPGAYVLINLAAEMPQIGGFEVADDLVSSMAQPQADVIIDMVDFAYAMPDELPAGRRIWEITNSGNQWHEFTVTPLAPDTRPADFLAMLESLAELDGPPPADQFAFFWMPSDAGERAWVQVELEPGLYGFACLLPDLAAETATEESTTEETAHADHAGHVSHLERGMIRLVTVK